MSATRHVNMPPSPRCASRTVALRGPPTFWEGGVPILTQCHGPESYQGVGSFGLTGLTPLDPGPCLPDTTSGRNEGPPQPANSSRGFLCSAGELSRLALTSVKSPPEEKLVAFNAFSVPGKS